MLGDKIKKIRLEHGLTQAELADGICTQASISNLENNTSTPSLMILLEIGNRLNIELNELSEYAVEQVNPIYTIFKQVQDLRSQFKLKEACDLLNKEIDVKELKTNQEKKQYHYYLGITSLLGYNKISDATYNFNLGLQLEVEPQLEFLDILITNGIGLAYFMNLEENKALTYFEKSLTGLHEFVKRTVSLDESIEITKLYYTSANFYSKIKEYNKAINLCTLGIKVQQKYHINYDLERLYYEKAFNLAQLGKLTEARENYSFAESLAKMVGNDLVVEVIQKDRKHFNI